MIAQEQRFKVDETLTLLDPWFLAGLVLLAVLLAGRLLLPSAALPAADNRAFQGLPRTLRSRLTWLPLALQGLALAALLVALARPVTRDVIPLRGKGVDIVLVLDTSSSMRAQDMRIGRKMSRMAAAREKALEFAKARVHDRVGVVAFANFPELRCPLTLDRDAVAAFLRTIRAHQPDAPGDGTWIGTALVKAVKLVEESDVESKVIVLLSDGESTPGGITTTEAAKLAKDADVRVHTIGLGRPVEFQTIFGPRVQSTDFGALEDVSKATGGKFFKAESADSLGKVYEEIDKLEKVELEDPRYRTVDWFLWPLVSGAVVLLLGLLLEFGWIRRLP